MANICLLLQEQPLTVLCLTRDRKRVAPFQSAVLRSPSARFVCMGNSFFKALWKLRSLARGSSNLVIHAHGYKETVIACFFRLFFDSRIIVSQHGFTERNRKSKLYNYINKICCRYAGVERVVCVSRNIHTIYRDFGVDPRRLLHLPNGVFPDQKMLFQHRVDARKKLISRYTPLNCENLILFAGRLSTEKDPVLFLSTLAEMINGGAHVHGLIAGDGPLRQELEELVVRLGLGDRVTLLGFVDDIESLLVGVDLLVLTSSTEGLPMVILESMAVGTPVVSTAVGDVADIIISGTNGMLVRSRAPGEIARACCQILADGPSGEGTAESCRETIVKSFSLYRQREVYEQLYGI